MSVDDQRSGTRPTAAWALEQILGLIAHGAPGPGKQLPTERDLALQLGVSRGSVREATSALVSLGVLDPRHGSGVYVTSLEPERLMAGLRLVLPVAGESGLGQLAAVHTILEGGGAAIAAARADAGDNEELAHLAELVAAAADVRAAAEADRRLHLRLAEVGGNPMLGALSDAMIPPDVRRAAWRAAFDGRAARSAAASLHAGHQAILAAVQARDPEAARAHACAHSAALLALAEKPGNALPSLARPRHKSELQADNSATSTARETPEWYRDAKLGVLIHWGPYSVPGWAPLDESLVELLTDAESSPHGEEGEPDPLVSHPFAEWYENSLAIEGSPTWHYHRATYGSRGYESFRRPFESAVEDWDAGEWAALFADAGVRYAVQVTKHHDGYLLWPARARNRDRPEWASERDVVGETAEAVRARGLRFGVYYSSGIDWSFANLPIRRMVDTRSSCPPGAEYAQYVEDHWRELMNRYDPSILWNDMGYPTEGDALALFREFYARVPDGLVNDRFWVGSYDLETPNYARRHRLEAGAWEMARPVGISYGWNRQESAEHTLSGDQLIKLLIDVVSKDGNLLLGVSPDDRGRIPQLQQRALRALGAWLEKHGEAIYGTRAWTTAESSTADGVPVRFTTKEGDLYIHLLGEATAQTVIPGLYFPPRAKVHDLTTNTPIKASGGRNGSVLALPHLLEAEPVRVLRVHPCPPALED